MTTNTGRTFPGRHLTEAETWARISASYAYGGSFGPDRLGGSGAPANVPTPDAPPPAHIPPDLWARAGWSARLRYLRALGRSPR